MSKKIYNEACGAQAEKPKNTGSTCEGLESVATMYFLAKSDFKATVAEMKNLDKINEFILDGSIVPMFDMYEVDAANTDAEVYETGNFFAETKKASKGVTFEHYLGFCSHSALKSYENSVYTKYIEVTDEGYLIGVFHADGEHMTGETIKAYEVGMRMRATSAKPPYTTVTIKFDDSEELENNAIHIKPDYNPNVDVKGVFEIAYNIQSYKESTKTFVIDMAFACSGTPMTDLTMADVDLLIQEGGIADDSLPVVVSPLVSLTNLGQGVFELESSLATDNGTALLANFYLVPKGEGLEGVGDNLSLFERAVSFGHYPEEVQATL